MSPGAKWFFQISWPQLEQSVDVVSGTATTAYPGASAVLVQPLRIDTN